MAVFALESCGVLFCQHGPAHEKLLFWFTTSLEYVLLDVFPRQYNVLLLVIMQYCHQRIMPRGEGLWIGANTYFKLHTLTRFVAIFHTQQQWQRQRYKKACLYLYYLVTRGLVHKTHGCYAFAARQWRGEIYFVCPSVPAPYC